MKFLGNPSSGSQANTTASRNAFGQYTRTRATPVNPGTTAQTLARSILATLARFWKTLTSAQRLAWKSLALQVPRTDSLGQTITLSGFQEFISVNAKRNAFGDATVSDAPAAPSTLDALSNVSLTHSGAVLNCAWVASGSLTGQKLGFYASPPQSAGVTFVSDLRLIQISGVAPTSPVNIGTAYATRFGTLTAGDRVFVSVENYNAGFTNPGVIGTVVL